MITFTENCPLLIKLGEFVETSLIRFLEKFLWVFVENFWENFRGNLSFAFYGIIYDF